MADGPGGRTDAGATDGLTLELERVLPAAPNLVFDALRDAGQVTEWWGPQGFTVASLRYEPRVGERYRIEMQPPEGDTFYLSGEFREVDPPARLSFTFVYDDPDPDDVETLVTLYLRGLDDSTAVAMTQGPFKTEARRALHRDGWGDSFDRLERFLSARD
jgi:uncharacterized protein YndB with AHSA1/START domain